jgi:hypothetical protein
MNRRDFLRLASSVGLTVVGPAVPRLAFADGGYEGLFFVTIHASGGWDPTLLCDPKGALSGEDTDAVNRYLRDDIEEVGAFRLAPVAGNLEFFTRWNDRILVLNGVDTGTNSHDTGTRHVWSGGLDASMPAFSALVAAAGNPAAPLSFLTYGGYDVTDNLVPPARMSDTNVIEEISYPHRMDPTQASSLALHEGAYDRIAQARAERLGRLQGRATLPRQQRALSQLFTARSSDNELARLLDFLPESIDQSNNQLLRQAQVAIASFKAGVSVSANLAIGGFDTHGNHDQNHTPNLQRVVAGVDFVMQEAERQGLADRVVVVVGSDFARTPWYNDTNGKDHWSVTSVMLVGEPIWGGRVIGGTDERQNALRVDPTTLALSETGVVLTPGHVHAALRELAGISDHPLAAPYRVDGDLLPLFG